MSTLDDDPREAAAATAVVDDDSDAAAYESSVRRALILAACSDGYKRDGVETFVRKFPLEEIRRTLGNVLIQLSRPASSELCDTMDTVLRYESRSLKIVDAARLRSAIEISNGVRLAVWRGDICTLKIDAIVNAANGRMLGCFQPSHKCIDNVIHRASGPRLREACRELIRRETRSSDADEDGRRVWELAAGDARLTRAFGALPSKFVVHTVGPIVPPEADGPSARQASQLASCYERTLALVDENALRSVAFCCVSTGLFGYPQRAAAEIAMRTVKHWVRSHPTSSLRLIVFNVFLENDHKIYLNLMHPVARTVSDDGVTLAEAFGRKRARSEDGTESREV